jgi:hypothetical protein
MQTAEVRVREFLSREFPGIDVIPCEDSLADLEILPEHPAVGSLLIQINPDELTFFIGSHTHCHFDADEEDQALAFLGDLLRDRLVVWSGLLAGGVRERERRRRIWLPWIREFLWSGPLPPDVE